MPSFDCSGIPIVAGVVIGSAAIMMLRDEILDYAKQVLFPPAMTLASAFLKLRKSAVSDRVEQAQPQTQENKSKNLVVNYHFMRQCNYHCGFCFHTAKTSHVASLTDAKKGLAILKQRGMIRVNFSGGEPFLKAQWLGEMCRYCKEELQMGVSIVSNGSLIKEEWFKKYGQYLDALAISCDSFDPVTLKKIGREHKSNSGKKLSHIEQMRMIRDWCKEYDVKFKINSVICTHNKQEDMASKIKELSPCRWKVFQCLLIGGENASDSDLRDARSLCITKEDFDCFVDKHQDVTQIVPEDNETMRNSYLILDEYLRFLNNTGGAKIPTISVLENVDAALANSGFDCESFKIRSGEWFAPESKIEWSCKGEDW